MMKLNKVKFFTFFGIFAIVALLSVNMFSADSYPGIAGGNLNCYNCHNGPIIARDAYGFEPDLNAWPGTQSVDWGDFGRYSSQYVFVMSVSDPHDEENGIRYINTQFLQNGTHMLVKARMYTFDDGHKFDNVTHADSLAIIWHDNATDFQLQEFSQIGMAVDGESLDMWYLSTEGAAANSSMMAKDMVITDEGYDYDTDQDVSGAIHHGEVRGGVFGYWFYFIRELDTGNADDLQFTKGNIYYFSMAAWWGSDRLGGVNHFSSYDQTIVVGGDSLDDIVDYDTVVYDTSVVEHTNTEIVDETVTEVITETAAAASSSDGFTLLLVLSGIFVAIPAFRKYRN